MSAEQKYWWQERVWRVVQTNMREIDMRDIRAEQYVQDLQAFNANTVIINTGGIVASYETKFPFHFKNQFLTGDSLGQVIAACQAAGIRVICRVDFSKVRKPIYEQHPDWAYISPKGEIIDYFSNVHVCFNSEYQQQHALSIMREIIETFRPDGIFMNMGGYAVAYDYTKGWQGICQCENCRGRFREMYHENLPVAANDDDQVYQKYLQFQQKTTEEYYGNIRRLISEVKPDLLFNGINLLRGEAGTWVENALLNYHYKASEIVKLEKTSHPEKVPSVTSVDFIDMIYRFSAISPYQQELRIAESLANGGTADYYMCGRLDTHRDKSGYAALQRIFKYQKDHEEDYRGLQTNHRMALVRPVFSFAKLHDNEALAGYLGWFRLLSEEHYLFDCIEAEALAKIALEKYDTLILPAISQLSDATAARLDAFVEAGGTIVCDGTTGFFNEMNVRRAQPSLKSLGIKRVGKISNGNISAYFELAAEDKQQFARFEQTDVVYLRDQYVYADYADGVEKRMRLIPPHLFAPPESAYHTNITDYPAFTINRFGKGRAVYIPWKPGRDYRFLGFPSMANFMADLLENVLHTAKVGGSLPPMVEVTSMSKAETGAQYVHLVNGSGYFNGSYFAPLPLQALSVEVPCAGMPASVTSMVSGEQVQYELTGGSIRLQIPVLNLFEAIKIT